LQGQIPEPQRRREGGTLYLQCPYPAWVDRWNIKYCRHLAGTGWQVLHGYSGYSTQSSGRKITIEDNTLSNVVSVTMTELKAEDSGTYSCAYKNYSTGNSCEQLRTISLNVFKAHILPVFQGPSSTQPRNQATSLCSENTFIILSVVVVVLLLLSLIASTVLAVRYSRLLGSTGNREAEDTSDRPEGTAQPGSTGSRESSQDDSKGPEYINLDVQPQASPEDPVYCNVEPSQAQRSPQNVEYAVIAFSHSPRRDRQ
ncbi:CLM5 protein, partial [Notiomystis cincta]|nr:CLM5 protein [Notiomystis cincta]